MSLPPEAESLIAGAPMSAHVATSVDDRSHVAPVWYGYRDGVVSFLTGGRKLSNLQRNPQVALSIESAAEADVDWNVTLLGRATVVDDPERREWARGWMNGKYAEDEGRSDDPDPEVATDGGEPGDEPEVGAALVEVAVSSAAWNGYE